MGMKEMQREQGNPRVKGKGPENLRSRFAFESCFEQMVLRACTLTIPHVHSQV